LSTLFYRYLNDLHVLELRPQFFSASALWVKPKVTGVPPSPRESHSANLYTQSDTNSSFLIIFGGMNGGRLGDLHMLKLGKVEVIVLQKISLSLNHVR